ncbi:phosphoglucosamine mutase [Sulfoacidibacillus thermotolerans]|uniref:Phosphoglucosamine mutase n=1 Tax=Sulfoacidibacillus thermotolerans TaxID=1765684 RepID=A0A2U3DBJ4_SULT2|nr:phosphoglucosamine mutase [Sulfoacidibacillus thermotolerans]PWI58661.1 phosphoglucosamine mutase [Sulfoacidibacillus thermotolerans]
MARLFGTDGVRGVANRDLTPELAFQLGFAAARVLWREQTDPFFAVGKDTRYSGDLLETALISGVLSAGVDVVQLGILPTPGVAYLTRSMGATAGVMISASHNPMQDNGIKFFGADGFKLLDAIEDEIAAELGVMAPNDRPIGASIGRIRRHHHGLKDYVEFLKGTVRHRFDGMKIAVDAANGAAFAMAAEVLRDLGAEVKLYFAEPDGTNINVNCGSTHPETIARLVKETGADVGLAFDGDADRLIAVDEQGQIVDGDRIMLICALDMAKRKTLVNNTVVTTVMSNYGFVKASRQHGLQLVRTAVGDRYVMEAMREGGYVLGGEQSGHVIFLQHNTTGDGVLTALQLLDVMMGAKQRLSELASVMRSYPQVLVNVRVQDKVAWRNNAAIAAAILQVEEQLGDDGRVLVRESGTEPIVRVMVEGPQEEAVTAYAESIVSIVKRELGA